VELDPYGNITPNRKIKKSEGTASDFVEKFLISLIIYRTLHAGIIFLQVQVPSILIIIHPMKGREVP
jgi:hypothetical protein